MIYDLSFKKDYANSFMKIAFLGGKDGRNEAFKNLSHSLGEKRRWFGRLEGQTGDVLKVIDRAWIHGMLEVGWRRKESDETDEFVCSLSI